MFAKIARAASMLYAPNISASTKKIGNSWKIYKIFEKVYMTRQQFKSELTFIPLLEECLRAFNSVNSSLFESKTFHSPIWLGTPFDVALVVSGNLNCF